MSRLGHFERVRVKLLRVYKSEKAVCACKLGGNCPAPGKHPAPWDNPDFDGSRGSKKHLKNEGVHNAKHGWKEEEFDGYNVAVACGDGLLVVDVDPRNGGHFTWQDICKGKQIPDTWTVATGGGGHHYYFTIPKGHEFRSFSHEGIDFQYAGKYVVAPPSVHCSGREYEFEDCDPDEEPPAEIPDWLLEWTKEKQTSLETCFVKSGSGNVVPADWEWDWISSILEQLSPDIPHDQWIGVGMGLHATGDERAFHLWAEWSAKGEKYRQGECQKRWKSFHVVRENEAIHTYRWLFKLAELYKIDYAKQDLQIWQCTKPASGCEQVAQNGGKIISELFRHASQTAFTVIPEFGLATSLQLMSVISQGSYLTPSGGSLNLYQWCAAPAGTGKDSFFQHTKEVCRLIHEGLLADEPGSVHGLRNLFYAWNSRLFIGDEFHDSYHQMCNPRNSFLRALLKEYKQLWNMPPAWEGSLTKTARSPKVIEPVLGILAFSTVAGLEASADPEFLSSGLGSRFLFWPVERRIEMQERTKSALNPEIIASMKRIFEFGMTRAGEMQLSIDEQIDKVHAMYAKGSKLSGHEEQMHPAKMLTEGAGGWFEKYRQDCWNKSQDFHLKKLYDHGNAWSRVAQMVERVASLRALSDESTIIEREHYDWAKNIVEMSLETSLAMFTTRQRVTHSDEDVMRRCEAVERRIRELYDQLGRGVTKTEVQKSERSQIRVSQRNVDEALVNLVQQGRIICRNRQGTELLPASSSDIPYGATWIPKG